MSVNKWPGILSLVLFVASSNALAEINKSTLLGSVQNALTLNPKTQANTLRLQAMLEEVQKQKSSKYPTAYLKAGVYRSAQSKGAESSAYRSREVSVGVDWAIFEPSRKFRIQEAQCDYKQQEAEYNATNPRISNTQGELAGLVVNNYIALVRIESSIKKHLKMKDILSYYLKAAKNEDEISRINRSIRLVDIDLKELDFKFDSAKKTYLFLVTVSPPETFEKMDDSIRTLIIPEFEDEALRVAMQKSPEIRTAELRIECMNLSYRGDKRDTLLPRVNVGASTSRGRENDVYSRVGMPVRSSQVYLEISKSFNVGDSSGLNKKSLEISAARKDLEGVISDLKADLSQYYPRTNNFIGIITEHEADLAEIEAQINELLKKIQGGGSIDVVFGIDLLNSFDSASSTVIDYKQGLLETKFLIQKRIGTLFDQLKP